MYSAKQKLDDNLAELDRQCQLLSERSPPAGSSDALLHRRMVCALAVSVVGSGSIDSVVCVYLLLCMCVAVAGCTGVCRLWLQWLHQQHVSGHCLVQ